MFIQGEKIADNVHILGNVMLPAYLIVGSKACIMIDAGTTIMGPIYLKEIREYAECSDAEARILLTHSHYDHLGSAAYLKRHLPNLKVGGYYTIDNVLGSNHAVELITSLNNDMEKMMDMHDPEITFKSFKLDIPLKGGETFDSGEDTLEAIYTPGHTRDSMCYYLKKARIMFTGEAAGIMEVSGNILPEFLASYKLYLQSLERLKNYPVNYVAVGHGYVVAGDNAKHYFADSIRATHIFIERVRTYYKMYNSVDATAKRIKDEDYVPSGVSQPERAYMLNLRAKIKAIAEDK